MSRKTWDVLIRNALVFDGSGETPREMDIAIKSGRIAAKGMFLPRSMAAQVIDGSGQWLMPGLLDIHTHLDLEVDLDPGLSEVVRHGTTTVLVGNCSLGTAFGSQQTPQQNPIVDCFTRVENIPKPVLQKCVDAVSWNNTAEYLDHFAGLPLGPNVGVFLPHSMLRVEAMGLEASISRAPSAAEQAHMESLLEAALDQGYLGLSTDGLPFHYLANEPHKDRRIPTQFASFGELRRLLRKVRERGRVWQTTPILENRLKAFFYFTLTSGRLFGTPLKTTGLSAIRFALAPRAVNVFLGFAALMNSWLFRGRIHFQALGTNFRVWSDGIVSPLYEELPAASRLIACEYEDVEGRRALLDDPQFVEQFRREWRHGRGGRNLATLRAKLGMPDNLVPRELAMMHFDGAPVPQWEGESLDQVYRRLCHFQNGGRGQARSDAERAAFERFPDPVIDDAGFMLHLMREYDKGFRYYVDVANLDEGDTLDLLLHEQTLPGFNDSGAHITNMAFFDTNLNSLKLAQRDSLRTVATMVRRLTREPAEFFGLDVGSLELGAQADITMLDPQALASWDDKASRQFIHRPQFEHRQLVSRSDGVVTHTFINGEEVWCEGAATAALGSKTLGRALRAG
ncbi:aminoacylase [Mangrovimicrobium sediminis]|uniref:Aminoacylase n=1 Tax=Mangrovimicrobium sediminis TaxID=2562682 RepID=A0A4Z0LWH1_9GAMM|nr:amidohydrolase family protein [Haliea sp. SAOS-164]TGD71753.1 aminoacylase [Haliea sp. SAOS-164]